MCVCFWVNVVIFHNTDLQFIASCKVCHSMWFGLHGVRCCFSGLNFISIHTHVCYFSIATVIFEQWIALFCQNMAIVLHPFCYFAVFPSLNPKWQLCHKFCHIWQEKWHFPNVRKLWQYGCGILFAFFFFLCAIFEKWQQILSNLTTGVDALAHALLRHSWFSFHLHVCVCLILSYMPKVLHRFLEIWTSSSLCHQQRWVSFHLTFLLDTLRYGNSLSRLLLWIIGVWIYEW